MKFTLFVNITQTNKFFLWGLTVMFFLFADHTVVIKYTFFFFVFLFYKNIWIYWSVWEGCLCSGSDTEVGNVGLSLPWNFLKDIIFRLSSTNHCEATLIINSSLILHNFFIRPCVWHDNIIRFDFFFTRLLSEQNDIFDFIYTESWNFRISSAHV